MATNNFLKNILTLVSGTASAQLILLLISPVLTRLYSAQQFGNFGVFVSIITILLVLVSLKYELALPLVKQHSIAKVLLHLCFILIVLSCTVVAVVVYAFDSWLIAHLNLSLDKSELYLIPVALFACGCYQLLHFYAIKTESFRVLSVSKVTQSVIIAIAQVGLSLWTVFGLVLGHTFGFIASTLVFLLQKRDTLHFNGYNPKRLLAVAKRFKNFPKYTLWASLANTSSTMLPVVLFSGYYSAALVGLYILAHRMLFAPVTLIGNAVGNVFMSNAKHYLVAGTLAKNTLNIHNRLILIAMPIMALTLPFLPEIFAVVFGEKWTEAGEIAQFIAIWIYFVFTASPISTVLVAMEKQKLAAYFDFGSCIVRLGSVVLLSSMAFKDAIMYFSIINALVVSAFILLVFSQLNISIVDLIMPHLKAFAVLCLPSFVIIRLLAEQSDFIGFLSAMFVVLPLTLLMIRKKI
ncbi:hypothetical protein EXT47_14335 [Pseudoalteromonas sp. CO342X]|uniref:lipopolysaccharide biosynthesis protein n=1 Tax=Pseudoalteromonas sp. CO342X TaxID=1777270 RepID=UPI00102398B3|nr:oligosaccharide flippase family protein [Pseudoalteromonas sp. CO342X]RZG14205.1 hypothetical protein EXT47_14335 [Pseudoalteromonas sp. CO342X]